MRIVTENYVPKMNKYYIFSVENGKISSQRQEFDDIETAKTRYNNLIQSLKNTDLVNIIHIASGKQLKKMIKCA